MKIVAYCYVNEKEADLSGYDEIRFGEGKGLIAISVRQSQVDVRTWQGRIIIIPQASNCVYVSAEDADETHHG